MDLRARSAAAIVRPHSADFLEYEARAEAAAAAAAAAVAQSKHESGRAPRPKSSLDINRTPDSFYYSEASYAEKMRKSALYLQSGGAGAAQPQQAGSYRTAAGDFGSGVNTIGYENPYERAYKRQELLAEAQAQGGVASSMPRMSRSASQGAGCGSVARSASALPQQQQHQHQLQQQHSEELPPLNVHPGSIFPPSMSTQEIICKNEQFLRSASARLPKRSGGMDDDYSAGNSTTTSPTSGAVPSPQHAQEGERKREESMKRLLEWKQRMLQSPLTRKGVQQGGSNMSAMSKLGSNPNILLSSTAVASGARYGPQAGKTGLLVNGGSSAAGGGANPAPAGGIQRSRSETQANVGPGGVYNSYSSDDEGKGEGNTPTTPTTTPTINAKFHLKPILKVHEASRTPIIQVQPKRPEERPKLKLQLPPADIDGEDGEQPVPILPKKTAPKSPQNANYVPVYNNKLVSSGNYENMEFGKPIQSPVQVQAEAEVHTQAQAQALSQDSVAINDLEETPMLMQLKLFKEQQREGRHKSRSRSSSSSSQQRQGGATDRGRFNAYRQKAGLY
ncbi:GL23085 [Drosophila persimilis]|uniref:GL23085 n=1 Tax=Drosophila persimilis TaxID=7234 RepID=B4G3I4_DROPE|nr:GL23085 [Drosophila persimilis]